MMFGSPPWPKSLLIDQMLTHDPTLHLLTHDPTLHLLPLLPVVCRGLLVDLLGRDEARERRGVEGLDGPSGGRKGHRRGLQVPSRGAKQD